MILNVENYDGEITWISSDTNVVAVDIYGQITALKEGTAFVMALIEDIYLTCTVNVSAVIDVTPLSGDANSDGKLNVRDCAFIAKALSLSESDKLPAQSDFNNDEKINVRDAAAIAKYLAYSHADKTT